MIKETSQKFVNGLFSLIFEKNNNKYLKKMMKKRQVVAVGGYSSLYPNGLFRVRFRQVYGLLRVYACLRFTQGLGGFTVYSGFGLDRFHCII
jgi:hypothetical protein